jgi:hypothetical protein
MAAGLERFICRQRRFIERQALWIGDFIHRHGIPGGCLPVLSAMSESMNHNSDRCGCRFYLGYCEDGLQKPVTGSADVTDQITVRHDPVVPAPG